MARTNSPSKKTLPSDLNVTPEIDDNATLGVMTEFVPPCTLNGLLVAPSVKEVTNSRVKKKRPNSPVTHNTSVGRKRNRTRVNAFSPNPKQEIIAELDTPKFDSDATKVNFAKHKAKIVSEKPITRSTRSSKDTVMEGVKPQLGKNIEPVALTQRENTPVKSTIVRKTRKILMKQLLDKEIEPVALTQQEITPVKSSTVRKRKTILMKPILDKEIEPVALTQHEITPVKSTIVGKRKAILQQDSPPKIKNIKKRQSTANVTPEKVNFQTEDTAFNENGLGSSLPKVKTGTKRKAQSKLLVHDGEKNGPKIKKKPSKISKRKQPSCQPYSDKSVFPSTSRSHLPEHQGLAETLVDNTANINVISANNFPGEGLSKQSSVNAIPVSCKKRKTNSKKANTKKKPALVKKKWEKPNPPTIISIKLKPFTDWSSAVCEKSAEQPNDQEINHLSLNSKCGKDKKLNTLKKTKKAQNKRKLGSKFTELKTNKSTPKEQKRFNYPILNNTIPENPKPGLASLHRATDESSDTSLVTVSTLAIRLESTSHSWANISTSTTSTSHLVPICGKIPTLRIIRLNSTNHRSLMKPTTLSDTTNSSSDRDFSNTENLETSCKGWQGDTDQTNSKESYCDLVRDNNVDLSLSSDNNKSNVVSKVAYISNIQKIRQSDEAQIFFKDLKLKDHYARVSKERKIKEKDSINANIPKPTFNEITFTQQNKTIFRIADSSQNNWPNSSSYAESHPTSSKNAKNLLSPSITPQAETTTNELNTKDAENLLPLSNTTESEPNSKDAENLLPPSNTTEVESTISKDAENFLPPSSTPQAKPTTKDVENLLPTSSTPQVIPTTSRDDENTLPEASNHLGDDTLSIYTNIFSEESIYSGSSAGNSSYNHKRSKKNSNRQKFVCEKQNADSTSLAYTQPPSNNKTIASELASFKPGLIIAPNVECVVKEDGATSKLFQRICKANLDKACTRGKLNCFYYHIPTHTHDNRVIEILSKIPIQKIINEYVIMREILFGKLKIFFHYANMFLGFSIQHLHGPLITEIMLDLYNIQNKHNSIMTTNLLYLDRGLCGLNMCPMRKNCFALYTRKLINGRRFADVLLEVIGGLESNLTSICVELLQVVKDIGEQVPIQTAAQLIDKCCRESDNIELIEATYQLVIRNTSNDILANVVLLKKFLKVLLKNSTNNEDFEQHHKQLAIAMTSYVSENVNRQSNQSNSENMCVPNLSIPDAAYKVGENSALASLVQRAPPMMQYNANPPRMNLPQHSYRTSPDTTQYPDLMNNQIGNNSRIPSLLTPRRSCQYQPQRMQGVRFPYQPRQTFRGRWCQSSRAPFQQRPRF